MWKELHNKVREHNVAVVTICLEVDPSRAMKYLDVLGEDTPEGMVNLIDQTHSAAGTLGLINVPMALWVEADGTIVRPAHYCPVSPSPFANRPLPEGLPPRMLGRVELLAARPDRHAEYLAALHDWAANGPESTWALDATESAAKSGVKTEDHANADAEFALGEYLFHLHGNDAAVPHWREAHRLHPENLGYKRQAWSLITTAPGADVDLVQEDTGPYDGNWLDDCRELGMDVLYPDLTP